MFLDYRFGVTYEQGKRELTATQVGTRSHLFRTKIKCLWGASFLRYCSTARQRVPIGSLASSTFITTSEESMTYY